MFANLEYVELNHCSGGTELKSVFNGYLFLKLFKILFCRSYSVFVFLLHSNSGCLSSPPATQKTSVLSCTNGISWNSSIWRSLAASFLDLIRLNEHKTYSMNECQCKRYKATFWKYTCLYSWLKYFGLATTDADDDAATTTTASTISSTKIIVRTQKDIIQCCMCEWKLCISAYVIPAINYGSVSFVYNVINTCN